MPVLTDQCPFCNATHCMQTGKNRFALPGKAVVLMRRGKDVLLDWYTCAKSKASDFCGKVGSRLTLAELVT